MLPEGGAGVKALCSTEELLVPVLKLAVLTVSARIMQKYKRYEPGVMTKTCNGMTKIEKPPM